MSAWPQCWASSRRTCRYTHRSVRGPPRWPVTIASRGNPSTIDRAVAHASRWVVITDSIVSSSASWNDSSGLCTRPSSPRGRPPTHSSNHTRCIHVTCFSSPSKVVADGTTGVYRIPDANESARNYYLIVEAIGPDGRPLTLPITSEENGRTSDVSSWGVRVPQETFDTVARDKRDNGIIENRIMGEKLRGELDPRYRMSVFRGAITSWDE